MTTLVAQITSLTVVYSTVYSDANQRKHQSWSVTGLCVGNSPGPVNSPHKGPVTRKMFPFDDVIMDLLEMCYYFAKLKWGTLCYDVILNPRYKNTTRHQKFAELTCTRIKQSDFLLMILAHGLTITILLLLLFLDMRFEYIKWGRAIMVRKRREMWIALPCSGRSKWTLGNRCKKRITSSRLTGTERKDP